MNMQIFERRESDVRGYSRTYPVVFDKALQNLRHLRHHHHHKKRLRIIFFPRPRFHREA
ncbi:hypothetical protein [Limnobacter sp. P1]|uniref:hypothetical protein n=1 Tax=Limnobacter olei TaxID=3031298 RepID=UPI0023AFE3D1|nr:hypothetical protein [Limnobacter sp. P1]